MNRKNKKLNNKNSESSKNYKQNFEKQKQKSTK